MLEPLAFEALALEMDIGNLAVALPDHALTDTRCIHREPPVIVGFIRSW